MVLYFLVYQTRFPSLKYKYVLYINTFIFINSFLFSLVHHYRILCFVLLFSYVHDLKIQALHWRFKVRSLKKPTNHETREQWSGLFFLTRLVQSILLFDQEISEHFNSYTHFSEIYCLLLKSSVQIEIGLNNYPLAKRFVVELKEEQKAMKKKEDLRFNI